MKIVIIFAVLIIRFALSTEFTNATGFDEPTSMRSELLAVNEGGFFINKMEIICGIYKITSPTKKVYIGQSVNINRRKNYYKRGNCKNQIKLYYSIKKHKWEKHKFEIIEQCQSEELNEREKYYVDLFQTFNSKYGLNLRDGGGSHGKMSHESVEKAALANRGKKRTKEYKLKMSLLMMGNKHWVGKKHKYSTILKMRASGTKRMENPDARKRQREIAMGNTNWLGKKHKLSTLIKMSIDNGIKKKIKQLDLNSNFIREWDSGHQVKKELGYDNSSIARVCRGKQKTSYRFKW